MWAGELTALHERFVHRFNRSEPRESALAYMRGLIAPLERKNGWTVAEEAGHGGPDRIQRMLNRIEWDADEVLDDVRDYVVEHLGDRDAVLIVDDTGFLKKGLRSAGVQRQYSGTAGARISISARQRGVGGSLRHDPVSVRPPCRSCSADQVRSDPAALR
ncbi:transposase [Streptomyces rishiriensis]|uniref:transposase n=1 Tax=Streptomyces rishiriensis TaxID=68264 RepID=UPI0037875607